MHEATGSPAAIRGTPLGLTIAVICVMVGTFMQVLDSTIANVSLPYMQGGLQASREQTTWVLTSYVIAAAIMTAPTGWLAGRFGRKNIFVMSMVGFTLSSMLCGAAQTLDQMILFRLLQGGFGAALSPISQSLILDAYPIERRGSVMAMWSLISMIGPILGPTLGGYLTDYYSWRWVFYVNVPFGIVAITGVVLFLEDKLVMAHRRFDWTGFAFLSLALGAFQLCFDRGSQAGWFESGEIIAYTVIGGVGLYLFVVHFMTSQTPFIPHGLFKDRNYLCGLLMTVITGMLIMATSALLPPFLQTLGGYTVVDTGMVLAPRGLGMLLTVLYVSRVVMKTDVRILMAIGSGLILWTMWAMSDWTPSIDTWTLTYVSFVQGAGIGLIFIPSNVMAFATLPQHLRTDASAMINLVRNVASAIGVSVTTAILTSSSQTMHSYMASQINPFNRALGVNAPSVMMNPQISFGLAQANAMIERASQIVGYSDTFVFMFYASLPALLVILFMRRPAVAPPPQTVGAME